MHAHCAKNVALRSSMLAGEPGLVAYGLIGIIDGCLTGHRKRLGGMITASFSNCEPLLGFEPELGWPLQAGTR